MLKAKLVVVGGDAKVTEVRLKLPTIIGRGKEAGLTVPHGLVSRRHTEIFERAGKLFVRDMGSLNGTYVNNTRIEDEQPLEPNQLLTLGNITFRAVYEVEAPAGEEQVSFEEVAESAPVASQSETKKSSKNKTESLSEVVAFDETVSLESFKKQDAQKKQAKKDAIKVKEKLLAVAATPDAETPRDVADASVEKNQSAKKTESAKKKVAKGKLAESNDEVFAAKETEGSSDAASDTDKSFVETHDSLLSKFALETEDADPASKSVLASALDELPAGQSAVSFVGGIELDDKSVRPASQIDPVEIDLGDEKKQKDVEKDSSLGSFLNKLPR